MNVRLTLRWLIRFAIAGWAIFATLGYYRSMPCDFRTFSAQIKEVYAPIDRSLYNRIKSFKEITSVESIANQYNQNIVTIQNIFGSKDYTSYAGLYGKQRYGLAVYTYPADDKDKEIPFFLEKEFKKGDYLSQCQNVYVTTENPHPEDK